MIDTVDIAGWLRVDLVGYESPRRISKQDMYWAGYKKLLVWGRDKSLSEMLKSPYMWKHKDADRLSKFEHRGAFQMAIFIRGGELGDDLVVETFKTNKVFYMYSGFRTFGHYIQYEDPSKIPVWKLGQMVDVEKDKKRFRGITQRLLEGGHEYLLTPTWYIYPAKAKLSSIAAD